MSHVSTLKLLAVFQAMNQAPSAAGGRTKLYHRRHGLRQKAKTLGHLVPAMVLVSSALAVFSGAEPFTGLVGLEFVIGAAYLLLMVRELRHLRHNPHHEEPVAWLELAAAGILGLEGYHIWHRHHEADLLRGTHRFHILPFLYGALALLYVGIAFGLARVNDRRYLHLHENGFSGRLKPFGRAFGFAWAEVKSVEPAGAADLVVTHVSGKTHRYSFDALHDGPTHRDQVLAHARRQLAVSNEQ